MISLHIACTCQYGTTLLNIIIVSKKIRLSEARTDAASSQYRVSVEAGILTLKHYNNNQQKSAYSLIPALNSLRLTQTIEKTYFLKSYLASGDGCPFLRPLLLPFGRAGRPAVSRDYSISDTYVTFSECIQQSGINKLGRTMPDRQANLEANPYSSPPRSTSSCSRVPATPALGLVEV